MRRKAAAEPPVAKAVEACSPQVPSGLRSLLTSWVQAGKSWLGVFTASRPAMAMRMSSKDLALSWKYLRAASV